MYFQVYGGLEPLCFWNAKQLALRGHDVTMAASFDSPRDVYKELGIRFVPTIPSGVLGISEKDHHEVWWARLKKEINEFDIIHDETHIGYIYREVQRAEIDGKEFPPIVKVLHDELPILSPPHVKYPRLVGVSHTHAFQLSQKLGTPIIGVPNGIPIEDFQVQDVKDDYFLFFGRMQHLKGPHVAIQACRIAGAKLIVAGEDTHFGPEDAYVNRIKGLCDGEQIQYYGKVTNEERLNLMQNAKAVILPSLFQEPFGLMAIEAMACGTPVLALSNGALAETIVWGETGIYTESVLGIVDAIDWMDDGTYTYAPEACREQAEKYTCEIRTDNFEQLYRDILEGDLKW